MSRKINVFIGGSLEALSIATKLTNAIEALGNVQCTVWNDGVFEFNKSFLDSLSKAAYSFDFGVLVATKDDIALIKKSVKDIPRDNVIFEYGLFLGTMGNSRTFLLQEKDVNLPTDLLGYTTPRFSKDFDDAHWNTLAKQLDDQFQREFAKSNIQALPSTSLAIGYFDSFLKKLCRHINERKGAILNKNKFQHSSIKVQIIIPDTLSDDIGAKAKILYETKKYLPDEIGDSGRPFPIKFFRKVDDLVIVDMPTTLNAIRPSVSLLIPSTAIGLDQAKEQIERKELENFVKTLNYLISQNDYSKNVVEIVWESDIV
ncbi:MAG: nucleotide-binding protein [Imperialibacter sp.]|uniref:STING domain-containing protein n=1 Tax=Imperialibacter sp. TaxID=2038411 RepID=UPI0032ED7646